MSDPTTPTTAPDDVAEPVLVLVRAFVASTSPVMLAGGRPAEHGEELDVDPDRDGSHLATGALVRLPDPDDLDALTRDDLDALALEIGVEDPHKLQNKAAVIAAIHAADHPED